MSISHRRTVRTAAFVLLGVLAGGMLGCAPEPEPSPTPTAAFASEEEAFAAAEEVYRAYIAASNEVDLSDPSSFEPLEEFTEGSYQSDEREELSELHAEGVVQTGEIHVIWFHPTTSDLDSTVEAVACNDVSETDLLDRNGDSLVSPSRPPAYAIKLLFNISDTGLRLAASNAIEDDECVWL